MSCVFLLDASTIPGGKDRVVNPSPSTFFFKNPKPLLDAAIPRRGQAASAGQIVSSPTQLTCGQIRK